jgi:hypothetical protein
MTATGRLCLFLAGRKPYFACANCLLSQRPYLLQAAPSHLRDQSSEKTWFIRRPVFALAEAPEAASVPGPADYKARDVYTYDLDDVISQWN